MRVTGGSFRSRALKAPNGDTTRPTSDRVRESLFAILESEASLRGLRVLDLYAGTGALAIEALSRGAASATLVEENRAALAVIRENVRALSILREAQVVPRAVEQALMGDFAASPFDLVLLDPPYAHVAAGTTAKVLALMVERGHVHEGSRIVLEHSKLDLPPTVKGLDLADSRRYGDTVLSFYKLVDSPAAVAAFESDSTA